MESSAFFPTALGTRNSPQPGRTAGGLHLGLAQLVLTHPRGVELRQARNLIQILVLRDNPAFSIPRLARAAAVRATEMARDFAL